MVDIPTAVGIVSSLMIVFMMVAMLALVYLGYRQDKEEVENEESNGEAAA